jgi:type I restriction enzyme S subunit
VSELPTGWIQTSLDDIADVMDYEREPINSSEREERIEGKSEQELYPYYGATGQVGFIDSFRSEGERVLLGEDAAPFLDPTKNKAYLATGRFWVNNHAHVLRGASELVDNRFLCHQLNVVDYHPFVTGSTRLKLTSAAMRRIPMVLAPAAEQSRIVAKLEELLSDLDAGVAELKAAQKKLQQYRQSLFKAAVEGALTADWREAQRQQGTSTETGAQLFGRILTQRRARWEARQLAKFKEQGKAPPKDWQKKYPEPVQPDTTDLPTLPHGWVWASMDQLVAESSYGTSVKSDYESHGTPVLRIPNVSGGRLDLRDMKFSTVDLGLNKDDPLAVGDVLVIRTNGSISLVGRAAAVVNELPTDHYFASYLLRLRSVEVSSVHVWILAVLTGDTGRQWLETRAASSAGQHNISLSTLLTMPVPLPSLLEQNLALEELKAGRESAERLEAATELSLRQSTAQRQNILRAAFSGQLLPQDPNDESASALLERIGAERIERAKKSKVRRIRRLEEIATVASKLIEVLTEAGDWVPAQEAFRRCGVTDGALTERVEQLYAELRELDKKGVLAVQPVIDARGRKLYDKLKLLVA